MNWNKLQVENMSNHRWRIWIKNVTKIILAAGIVIFLARTLIANWERIEGYTWEVRLTSLILSFVFLVLFYLASFFLWDRICRGMGVELSSFKNLGIWFFSQVGKYIPGKIWGAVGRIYLAERQGVRRIDTGVCLAYEAIFAALGGVILTLFTFPLWTGAIKSYNASWLFFSILSILVLMHPKIMGWFVNRTLNLCKIPSMSIPFSTFYLLLLLLLSLIVWVLGGIGFYFFVDAIYPVGGKMIVTYGGIFVASCMLSMMAFLIPAGLGVREGAFILLLQSLMPPEVAVVIAFGARFWMTGIEAIGIGLGGGVIAWYGGHKHGKGQILDL